jgi:hypothetical protein
MEGSLMAYKVFTNGSVLNASEINENLMRQSVMVFSNAAARTAAITSPVEGMLTYLEDVDRYEHWNSSAWVSPFGSTLIASQTFTNQATVSLNNVFTSTYRNYEVFVSFSGTVGAQFLMRFRAGGVDNSTNNYSWQTVIGYSGTLIPTNAGSSSSFLFGTVRGTSTRNFTKATFSNPGTSGPTKNYVYQSFDLDGGNQQSFQGGGTFAGTGVFDGITVYGGSGNITGEIFVYGMRS